MVTGGTRGIGRAICVALKDAGYRVAALEAMPAPLAAWGERMDGAELETAATYALVNFFVLPSIFWGLLNLIPVLPMDGGRIAQSLISLGGGHPSQAHWLGVIAAAAVAIYAYQSGQTFLAIFFVWMGIDNYQATQGGHGWR